MCIRIYVHVHTHMYTYTNADLTPSVASSRESYVYTSDVYEHMHTCIRTYTYTQLSEMKYSQRARLRTPSMCDWCICERERERLVYV